MFFFRKKRVDKAAWAALVYVKPPKNLERETEEHLSSLTTLLITQHHRIITESVRIVLATKNDETRRSRTELSRYHYQEIMKFKPYCNKEQLELLRQAESMIQKL